MMTENINFVSMNVQGLGDSQKRKDVLNYLKGKKYNVYFLQDTHFTNKEVNFIRSQWGYECYFSNYNSQSRGVAIFINNNFDFKFKSLETDQNGNLLIIHACISNIDITLICIYGPNRDDPIFYNNIKEKILQLENPCIMVGDFNMVLNPNMDYFNYLNINNPKAREVVLDMIIECNLIDCWREQFLEKRQYTWFKRNPIKKARLDFFLISNNLFTDMSSVDIVPGYRTDHSMILLSIQFGKFKKGISYWKFNNSLLKDSQYVNEIKSVISQVKLQYASEAQETEVQLENISKNLISFIIDDKLFFETLLMEIRGKTISYSSYKKNKKTKLRKN
jgi:exonuclease III